jgi:hypothetical protein
MRMRRLTDISGYLAPMDVALLDTEEWTMQVVWCGVEMEQGGVGRMRRCTRSDGLWILCHFSLVARSDVHLLCLGSLVRCFADEPVNGMVRRS